MRAMRKMSMFRRKKNLLLPPSLPKEELRDQGERLQQKSKLTQISVTMRTIIRRVSESRRNSSRTKRSKKRRSDVPVWNEKKPLRKTKKLRKEQEKKRKKAAKKNKKNQKQKVAVVSDDEDYDFDEEVEESSQSEYEP